MVSIRRNRWERTPRAAAHGLRALAMMLAVAVLAGCGSLPLPRTHDESLLIIPVEADRSASSAWRISSYRVEIALEGGEQRFYGFPAAASYLAIPMPPGRHTLRSVWVAFREQDGDGTRRDRAISARPLLVEALQVEIWDRTAVVREGNVLYASNQRTGSASRDEVVEAIRRDRRWAAWETHNRIGFPAGE